MSRGSGRVMSRVEEYLDGTDESEPVTYHQLAGWVYGVQSPTRAQLSAVRRAVGRLEEQGKARREATTYVAGMWQKPVPGRPGRPKWEPPPTRRGPLVIRETLVWDGRDATST